jgi:hypothetical protein
VHLLRFEYPSFEEASPNVHDRIDEAYGAKLAVLVFNGDVYKPVIWTRATGTSVTLSSRSTSQRVSGVNWCPSSRR